VIPPAGGEVDSEQFREVEAVLDALPHAAALLDADGIVLHANAALERVVGLDPQHSRGRALFQELLPAEEAEQVQDSYRSDVCAAGRATGFVTRLDGETGHGPLVELRLQPLSVAGRACGLALLHAVPESPAADTFRSPEFARLRHEIGNSLMGLVGNAELLAAQRDLPAELRHRVDAIFGESRRIHERLDELTRLGDG
jgi:PAS domain S-box-containing protein